MDSSSALWGYLQTFCKGTKSLPGLFRPDKTSRTLRGLCSAHVLASLYLRFGVVVMVTSHFLLLNVGHPVGLWVRTKISRLMAPPRWLLLCTSGSIPFFCNSPQERDNVMAGCFLHSYGKRKHSSQGKGLIFKGLTTVEHCCSEQEVSFKLEYLWRVKWRLWAAGTAPRCHLEG